MALKKGFIIDVDQAIADCDVHQVVQHLGGDLSSAQQKGDELRLPCFLACGHAEDSGKRVLSIQTSSRGKLWACHHYDCPVKGGNLAKLIDLATPGGSIDGKPRGERFKQVARTLKTIVGGESPPPSRPSDAKPDTASDSATPKVRDAQRPISNNESAQPAVVAKPAPQNTPLKENENERVRAIADLYQQLTMDKSQFSPAASRYVSQRPYLTPELAAGRHFGYLPSSSRGVLRGKFVYAINNRDGDVVAYLGRNLNYESECAKWEESDRTGEEPVKYHVPKNFQRGIELYGQEYLKPEIIGCTLSEIGLPVVEGCGDVLNLAATLKIRAVGLLSNRMTDQQRERIVTIAREVACGVVTLLYDNDEAGNDGAAADAAELAKYVRVQRAWSLETHADLAGMQAEQITPQIAARLREEIARSRSQ